jgi:hypothetical protein
MTDDRPGPPATAEQTLVAHRDSLLASGVLTHAELQRRRGDPTPAATRAWVSRQRRAGHLIAVTHHGRTLVPAFQLRPDGSPRPELLPLTGALAAAGVRGWTAFTWLTQPSAYLSGAVPHKVALGEPERALRAAQRMATSPR